MILVNILVAIGALILAPVVLGLVIIFMLFALPLLILCKFIAWIISLFV